MSDPNNKDANPYWYGSILEFNTFEAEALSLLRSKSIKVSRMREFAESCKTEDLSPIVRLVGFTLERIIQKYLDESAKPV